MPAGDEAPPESRQSHPQATPYRRRRSGLRNQHPAETAALGVGAWPARGAVRRSLRNPRPPQVSPTPQMEVSRIRGTVPARMLAQMPAQMPAQTVGTVLARTRLMRLLPMLTLARLVAMRLLPTRRPAMLRARVMARWQTSPRCLVTLGCPMPARRPAMLRPRVMAR